MYNIEIVNLVDKYSGAVTDTFSRTLTSTDFVLVDCVEGACKQTQGYVKDEDKIVVCTCSRIAEIKTKP